METLSVKKAKGFQVGQLVAKGDAVGKIKSITGDILLVSIIVHQKPEKKASLQWFRCERWTAKDCSLAK